MDTRQQAEAVIEAQVRNQIEHRGRMPSGSLEYNGADIEMFSGAVLVAMATCDTPDALMAALRQARETHIVMPLAEVAIQCRGEDVAADFEDEARESRAAANRSRIVMAAVSGWQQ
jgi:hypothetical protein